MMILRAVLLLPLLPSLAVGWDWGSGGASETDYTNFANSFNREWLTDGSAISLKLEGCVWGYAYDSEEAGCLAKSSQDGTSSWYMMSNCRRAQAGFSLYASGSSGNCNSGNFKESFVSTVGLNEFIGWVKEWDSNSPFNSDDGSGEWDADELPDCEQGGNGYIGLGCNSDGTFSINHYQDQYCQSSTGVYDTLSNLNYKLKSYKSCRALDNAGDGDASLATTLMYYTESCSSLDSELCTDDSAMQSRRSSASSGGRRHSSASAAHKSWTTKVKYAMGGVLLVASLIMFTGILFTNRRRRKALMQRRFRQSRSGDKSRRSRRSSSKSARSRSTKRSKSRPREEEGGVFT